MSRKALYISLLLSFMTGFVTFTATTRWSQSKSVIKQDGLVYFLIARSIVIDFDTDLTEDFTFAVSRLPEGCTNPAAKLVRTHPKTGRLLFPWPVGAGLVMAPFYALGYSLEHLVATFCRRKPDSLGTITLYVYGFGAIAYGLLGFWIMFTLCAELADKKSAYIGCLGITLAGPLVFYTFFQPTMAHAQSFAFGALFVFVWLRIWNRKSTAIVLLLFLYGLLITIRYQNILFGILPLCLLVRLVKERPWHESIKKAATASAACLLPVAVQGYHYTMTSGSIIDTVLFSAGNEISIQQNTFNLVSPHFFNVLFSCQHGAFYWAPVFGLGFTGLVFYAFRNRWVWVFIATFLAHVYLIGCLTGPSNWSAGGAFGMRYLTECSLFLAVGLTVLTRKSGKIGAVSLLGAIVCAVIWNSLLIMAFCFRTVPQFDCVSYPEMAAGMARALAILLSRII